MTGVRRRIALAVAIAAIGAIAVAAALAGDDGVKRATAPGAGTDLRAPPIIVAATGDVGRVGAPSRAVSRLVSRVGADHLLTLGDSAYPDGSLADYRRAYAPTWGRHRAITHPVPGNHDYHTPGAAGYFGYFGAAAGRRGAGFYSLDLGSWHVVALNSEGTAAVRSRQLRWLRRDLRQSRARCTLAFWHRPRFTAGAYADAADLVPLWQALHDDGAEVVLSGHDHNYQRYQALSPAGRPDRRGVRQFVVGTGGGRPYPLRPDSRRVAGTAGIYGVLVLRLQSEHLRFSFVPAAGDRFRDAGVIRCR